MLLLSFFFFFLFYNLHDFPTMDSTSALKPCRLPGNTGIILSKFVSHCAGSWPHGGRPGFWMADRCATDWERMSTSEILTLFQAEKHFATDLEIMLICFSSIAGQIYSVVAKERGGYMYVPGNVWDVKQSGERVFIRFLTSGRSLPRSCKKLSSSCTLSSDCCWHQGSPLSSYIKHIKAFTYSQNCHNK